MKNGKPTQLELNLQGGESPKEPKQVTLSATDVLLAVNLSTTARDFLWGKVLTGAVPQGQVDTIKAVCDNADKLIGKLKSLLPTNVQEQLGGGND